MPTVLIVDDDKHTRALLRTIFTQDSRFAHHELAVIEAGDGKEGLALFDDKRPAIVVTDLLMPKMDGFQLCEAIRGRQHGQDTGLIVVSGVYRDLTASTRVREEFRGSFFAKPYQLADLASAVDQLLVNPQRKPAELAAPAPAADLPAQGSLVDTPLPRLLLDLWERRATGALEIRRAGLEKRIDLVVGHPASVSSNQRTEALGEFLLGRRIITPAQHQRALRRAHDQGEKLGEALIELQILSSAQLVKALTAQARAKIVSALRWQEGTWSYTPNRDLLDRHKGNALDPGPVVLLGLKQTGHLDDSIKAVDAVGGRPLYLTSRGERLRPVIVRAFGEQLLAALDKPASVAAILEVRPDAATVMHALEALLVTGCLEPTGGKPTGTTLLPGPRPTASDPIALAGLSEAAGRRPSQSVGLVSRPAPQPARSGTIQAARVPAPVPAVPPPRTGSAPRPRPALTRPSTAPPLSAGARPVTSPPLAAPLPAARQVNNLLAELFSDDPSAVNEFDAPSDAVPELITEDEESGVIEVLGDTPARSRAPGRAEIEAARELLLAEYLRVQGPDLYEVLKLSPDADDATVELEYQARTFDFSLERFATLDLGPDHGKLEEIHAAYRRARDTLLDPSRRATYDARQHTPVGGTPALAGELAFHEGEKRLAEGDLEQAVQLFELALKQVPKAADYHAALGWTMYRRTRREALGQRGAPTAARVAAAPTSTGATARLLAALAIDPDHAAAHEYLGRILVESGQLDEEAARHLEQALAARPPRIEALLALDTLRTERREFAALERQYRLLIHSLREEDRPLALRLWLALAELYRTRLGNPDAARQALSAAARLAPEDPSIPRALDELTSGRPELWDERAEALRSRWRLDPGDTEAGRTLFRGALELGRHDEAFVAAALLRMRDPEDTQAVEHYERLRPRFLARAVERKVSLEDWPALRHAEDDPDLAALFTLLVELVATRTPLPLAELQVGGKDHQEEHRLPEAFARVRAWVAELLGVDPPDVYLREDFDDQVHAAAPSDGPPVLLCGPRALAQTDRVRLGFELARTMTYLWPGRGVAGSRPARRLRSVLVGCLASGGFGGSGVGISIEPDDSLAADSRAWMLGAPESRREDIRRLLGRLTAGRTNLNLSRWLRAMSRTADRVGLVMCGDPAVALRGADAAGGADAAEDLLDWARGREHLTVREGLGRSIAV